MARCALEADDGTQVRLEKLYGIIGECLYAVHDISRTSLDSVNRLPPFNMPLELGIFLGAKRFGGTCQRRKKALILERTRFLCQKYCSDISGQDPRAHKNDALEAICAVRNWLHTVRPRVGLPGGRRMGGRFVAFREKELPAICRRLSLERRDLTSVSIVCSSSNGSRRIRRSHEGHFLAPRGRKATQAGSLKSTSWHWLNSGSVSGA